jgi:secondary thiamine-phosphate synthase enzyme
MHHTLNIKTPGRSTTDITAQVRAWVNTQHIGEGICQLFIQHTSASLMLCENADPDVRRDLEAFMSRVAPDGDPDFVHTAEGPDDMPAHVRSVLTQSHLSIPIVRGELALGTWQGIYLWEHRHAPHTRRVILSLIS